MKTKGLPFVFKGAYNVEDCKTSEDVIKKSGLDFNVEKCSVIAKTPYKENEIDPDYGYVLNGDTYMHCPDYHALYRTDNNCTLGIVKNRYNIVQNIEAFKFFDDAIGKNEAVWQTAGAFGNGERVFVSAKLPNYISVHGDPVETYLVFTNSHDGKSGVKILFTPIRVVCLNTLNAAINTSSNFVSFRHTSSVHDNISTAHEILGICKQKNEVLKEAFTKMRDTKVKDNAASDFFAKLILSENEYELMHQTGYNVEKIESYGYNIAEATGISTRKLNIMRSMHDYYFNGIGQQDILGTHWGVYNAITGYFSNIDNISGENRMDSILYGSKAQYIKRAGELLLNAA